MFAFLGERHDMLRHIPAGGITATAEIGVCKGDNAAWMLEYLTPETLELIDPWRAFEPDETPDYFKAKPEDKLAVEAYYGGPVEDQATFDQLFAAAAARFDGDDRVTIQRRSSRDAAAETEAKSLDLIYIDADHGYAAVLDDLFLWHLKLREGGYIVLNDHAINASGTPHYGVVQAVTTFLRTHTEFCPIVMNLSNYADLVIGRRADGHTALVRNLIASKQVFEIPDSMISNFHMRRAGGLSWLSFC